MIDVLVRVGMAGDDGLERAVAAIERAGGRVRCAYPPSVIVASVPSGVLDQVSTSEAIASVHTGEIDVESVPEGLRAAIASWNSHLRQGAQPSKDVPGRGLSWGDPGRLPPDPPPEVREMLRRREREPRDRGPGGEPEG